MNAADTIAGEPIAVPRAHPGANGWVRSSPLLWLLVFAIANVALIFDLKTFQPWSQVTDLWNEIDDISELAGHFHLYRFIVAYPGLLLEDMVEEVGFSVYVSLFVATNAVIFRKICMQARRRPPPAWVWLIFFAVHAYMNGRGAIGWTGWLLCVYICVSSDSKLSADTISGTLKLFLIPISLFLASVTTGIFAATLVSFTYLLVVRKFARFLNLRVRLTPVSMLVLGLMVLGMPVVVVQAAGYFLAGLEKAMEFYGGGLDGVLGMATHGFGRLMENPLTAAMVLMLAIMGTFVSWLLAYQYKRNRSLLVLTAIPAAGGVFGYTILTLVIPVWLIAMTPQTRLKT